MDEVRASVFLSAVTDEFGDYREHLRKVLTRWNVEVKIQEDFINSATDTLEKLWIYIENADVVVQIAGSASGAVPADPSVEELFNNHPDLLHRLPVLIGFRADGIRLSYTQWEAWFALYHKKHFALFSPSPGLVRRRRKHNEQSKEQEFYLKILREVDIFPSTFENKDDLAVQVLCSPVCDFIVNRAVQTIIRRRSETPQSHRLNSIRSLRDPLKELAQRLAIALNGLTAKMNDIPGARVEGYENEYLVRDLVAIPRLFMPRLNEALESQNVLPPKLVKEVRLIITALEMMVAEFEKKVTWDYNFNRPKSPNRSWVGLMNREHHESGWAHLFFALDMVKRAAKTVERNLPERVKLQRDWPFMSQDQEFAEGMLANALRRLREMTRPGGAKSPHGEES